MRGIHEEAAMDNSAEMERVRAVKQKHERALLRKKNVVGVGIGLRQKDGEFTDQIVLTVMVARKEPVSQLACRDRIPTELEGVPVDVQEVGILRADQQGGMDVG
jgi:hypothetical protein